MKCLLRPTDKKKVKPVESVDIELFLDCSLVVCILANLHQGKPFVKVICTLCYRHTDNYLDLLKVKINDYEAVHYIIEHMLQHGLFITHHHFISEQLCDLLQIRIMLLVSLIFPTSDRKSLMIRMCNNVQELIHH